MTEANFPPVDFAEWRAQVERELKGQSFEEVLVSKLPGDLIVEALYAENADALPALPSEAPTQLCMPYAAEFLDEDRENDVRYIWCEDGATPTFPDGVESVDAGQVVVDALRAAESGAHIPLELAIALAGGLDRLRDGAEAASLLFRVGVGNELFAEMAKLRALRSLWAGILDQCELEPRPARIHAVSVRLVLSDADRWVNILRVGGAAYAAILGGANFFTPRPFEPGSRGAHRLARNSVHMLLAESHLGWYRDPAAGSFYLEALGAQIAERAWKLFQEIETGGGLAKAQASGWLDLQIDTAWGERLERLEAGVDALVGVTKFPNPAEKLPPASEEGHRRLARALEEKLRKGDSP